MRNFLIILLLAPVIGFSQMFESKFELSLAESKVLWEANYLTGGGHNGTLLPTSGFLQARGRDFIQGELNIDMNSIQNADLRDTQSRKDLEEHLRGKDFFDVDQFPTAKFVIVKVTSDALTGGQNRYKIQGLLQIKGRTNLVNFPVTIITTGKTINVVGDVVIDRTKWDITYQSKTIFSGLKDSIIEDEVKIKVDLTFKTK